MGVTLSSSSVPTTFGWDNLNEICKEFGRICDASDRDKGERHGILNLDFWLIAYCFSLETENKSFTLIKNKS